MPKKMEQLFIIFYLLIPFTYFFSEIYSNNIIINSLILFWESITFIYTLIYLLKKFSSKKIFLFYGFYFIIYLLYIINRHLGIYEILNLLHIFYLPFLILFFSIYPNKKYTKKTLFNLALGYFFLNLVFIIIHIVPSTSFQNTLIFFLPIVLSYLQDCNNYLLKILLLILLITTSLLFNSGILYLSLLITFIYFLIVNYKKMQKSFKRNNIKVLLTILVLLFAIVAYLPNNYNFSNFNIIKNLNVYVDNKVMALKNINNVYQKSNAKEKILGLGQEKVSNLNTKAPDIFTIFYTLGILGFLFYLILVIYVLQKTKLKGIYTFIFIMIMCWSYFTSDILLNNYLYYLLAWLFLVNQKDLRNPNKNILLVSNMYPSKQNPHYGVFVKNCYDLLKENDFSIDLVVMPKTTGKLKKLIAYIKFCGSSFIKSLLNNYDYIYVHFISHSTIGVYLPVITSKNTQLILNIHGNDLVADTKIDQMYLPLSKLFLKGADIVIVPSNYFARILMHDFKVSKNKIVVYPSGGVNIAKFKKISKKTALKNAKLKDDVKYFGFVSRIEKDKGYDILIMAINELKKAKKLEKIKFLLIGDGSDLPILNDLIAKYKLNKYIIRRSFVTQDELVNIYNALEALIYPTRRKSESLGLTGLEAMACETLVIGSNKYGPSDYLVDKENSITFDPQNYKELAEKIMEVLEMKSKDKQKLTKNARLKSEEYSIEKTKKIILKVFNRKVD